MPQSVLFISAMNGDPWGGSEEFWYRIAMWMAQNNYKVGCCFFEWASGKEEKIVELKKAGCEIYQLPNPKSASNGIHKMIIQQKGTQLLKKIITKDWDIVCISQGGYEDVTHRPFRFLYQYLEKFVLIYHNYNESHTLSKNRANNLNTWMNKAALNIGDAARIFTGIKKITGLDTPKQFVLKNPLTIPYQPVITAWPEKDDKGCYIFTMLAQLDTSRKAQDVLIKALASEKWKKRNWVLYLYGDGEDMQMLKALIIEKNIGDKIKLMGHTKSVYEVLKNTHLLLQVTHIDAMPLSVTEAMNMSRPCVVSNVGDMPLWIEHGKNGFIANAITEEGIDNVMELAWEQKENWEQMGKEAHRVFIEKYPQPYEKYYADLLMNL